MATFEVTGPDGARYQVTAPDDATDDQIMQYVQSQSAPKAAAAPKTGVGEAALIAAGRGMTQLGRGAQQAFYGLTGDTAAQDQLAAKVAEENRLYKPLQDEHPIATALGEGAPVIAGGPLTMAAAGGLEYGTPQEKATRAAAGFVGGKAGELIGKGIGRIAQPIRGAASDLFDKFKVQGLPGQITGSAPLQWIESTLASLPGGGRIRAAAETQQNGLNKAAMGLMGSAEDAVTPETVRAAKATLGDTFNTIPGTVTVDINQKIASNLVKVEQDYYKNLSPDQRTIVKTYIDDILDFGNLGGMPGDVYQKARSRIAARANSTQDSELKNALTGVYKALDRAFDDSAPSAVSEAMKTVRARWAAAKRLEPMATAEGDVSAARIANGLKDLPGDAGELAKLGSKLKALPNSGTAQRLIYQSLLSGGVGGIAGVASGDYSDAGKYAAASLAGPWLASQLLTRAPLKQYLTRGLLDVSPEVEKLLSRAGGAGGGLLGLSLAP